MSLSNLLQLVRGRPGRRHVYPVLERKSEGWTLMVARHGGNIASIETGELTGTTRVTLRDGTTDEVYVEADQIPLFRQWHED